MILNTYGDDDDGDVDYTIFYESVQNQHTVYMHNGGKEVTRSNIAWNIRQYRNKLVKHE
jgi:hypothetical protein